MKLEPTYTSVGSLFAYKPMFFIPKYQRAYAWNIEFNQEVQRVITPVEVLRLSKADHPFYKDLIRDMNPSPSRDSHKTCPKSGKALCVWLGRCFPSSQMERKNWG
jgi:hypothetical protein